MNLDIRTMTVMLMLTLAAAALTLAAIGRNHPALRGVEIMAIGIGSMTFGLLLVAARGFIPLSLSVIGAGSLITAGHVVIWVGLRRFIGAGPVPAAAFALPVAVTLGMAYYHDDPSALGLRNGLVQAHAAVFFGLIGVDMIRRWKTGGLGHRLVAAICSAHAGIALLFALGAIMTKVSGDFHAGGPLRTMAMLEAGLFTTTVVAGVILMTNERLIGELNAQATIDPLTGVYNRRAFHMMSGKDMSRFVRRGGDMAVLMIDLDRFKRLNDTHGHAAGDTALRHFVGIAQRILRGNDVFARFGGEEFIALLPETGPLEAMAVAERLRAAVEDSPAAVDGTIIPMTVSVGVCGFTGPGVALDDAIRIADAALYRAKAGGRNRVEQDKAD